MNSGIAAIAVLGFAVLVAVKTFSELFRNRYNNHAHWRGFVIESWDYMEGARKEFWLRLPIAAAKFWWAKWTDRGVKGVNKA